ncbi:PKD domain-containing protein [Cyclobacterium lianum]|uniref:PKD domain-containing protein n=1 Tax=Cyclobacterium lianum TaxID=388280 RepID=A0A1M7PSX1_9BACT|nr:PKD domain-containing protein [Cyclobacterium lianum]SHN20562.1 PKD domain-containing protein [Cyclobacterium lianum]
MKKYINYIRLMLPLLFMAACIEEYTLEEAPPTQEDADFSFEPTAESDNILQFTAANDFFIMNWDLGNGSSGSGKTVTGTFPTAGTYTVSLTVFNAGGSVTVSKEIEIAETDPLLLDKPLYNTLTGGADAAEGKTWRVDAGRAGHFGVGPNPSQAGDFPEWYQAQPNEKEGSGMYTDRYTFYLADFAFDMETDGLVYLNAAQGAEFPGAFDPGVGDLSAPYEAPEDLKWSIAEPEGAYPELTISQGGFIGYFAGGRTYQMVVVEENEILLRFVDQANTDLAWYIRLIPEDFVPEEEATPEPIDPGTLSLASLVGDGTKTWKLKPAVGAFGVGPAPGSDEFFPNGQDISADRACLFNDRFTFQEDGVYTYDPQDDIFGEGYMGLEEEGCQPVANLDGTPGEFWGAGSHQFSFSEATDTENASITVSGTGAFIALPKAFNGGEYQSGPPAEDRAVTYEVIGYTNEDGVEELTITIDISDSGSVFWTFVLIPETES